MVVEHNRRSTWRRLLRAPRDALLGGCYGDTTELDSSEPIISIPPALSRHPNGICKKQQLQLEEATQKVRGYDTTQPWESTQLREPRWHEDEMKMKWCLSTPGSPKNVLPITQFTSVTPVSPCICRRWLRMCYEAMIEGVETCTSMLRSSELRDALGGWDRVSLAMHCEAMIEPVWSCHRRPRLSQLSETLGGCGWASLQTYLQAMIEWHWRSAWKWSIWREAPQQLRLYSLDNL